MTGDSFHVILAGNLFSFPHGTGSTSRVLAIARGLRSAGAEVTVVPTEYALNPSIYRLNSRAAGEFHGIPFRYAAGTSVRPLTFMQRRIAQVRGVAGVATASLPGTILKPPDATLLFTGHTYLLPAFSAAAMFVRRGPLLFDGCEMPFVYERDSRLRRYEERIYIPFGFRIYDGVLTISRHLDRYFKERIGSRGSTLLVPILVDVERFAAATPMIVEEPPYIAYTGAIAEGKGVDILLRSFAEIAAEYPSLHLKISGAVFGDEYLDKLHAIVAAAGISERVHYLGTVSYEAFPALLRGATVLVVPHRSGSSADAAFPTKLGEYLASGVPTVVTRVGEIDEYVRDGRDVFMCEPGSVTALSAALRLGLSDRQRAAAIGLAGRETARSEFDYRRHGARMLDYMRELRDRRAHRTGLGEPVER